MAPRSGDAYPVTEFIAGCVKRLRDQRGWSTRILADKCAQAGRAATLSKDVISKIECRGRKWVTPEEINVLALVFGVKPVDLLGRHTSLTVLHLSDLRILPGSWPAGGLAGDAEHDRGRLLRRLRDDLERWGEDPGLRPDLVVVSGGLADSGGVREFDASAAFLDDLAGLLGLARHRMVIVPGTSDVSAPKCRAYFADCEADEVPPVPPYFPKWAHFQSLFTRLYRDVGGVKFDAEHPWTFFEIVDLQVVVAGLNSTMAVSHRAEDDYGQVGEEQAAWFAERLADYQDRGWLRIGVVGHSPVADAQCPQRLRDAVAVEERLGERLNLLLHGHGAGVTVLGSGLLALGAGTPDEGRDVRGQAPGQYQMLKVTAKGLTRRARRYDPAGQGWVADDGGEGPEEIPCGWQAADATFPPLVVAPGDLHITPSRPAALNDSTGDAPRRDTLLYQIAGVYRARHDADVQIIRGDLPYLVVSYREGADGEVVRQLQVGACVGTPSHHDVEAFLAVHSSGPESASELVYDGEIPDPDVVEEARRLGIRVRSLPEAQGRLDLRSYVRRQSEGLATGPGEAYRPQRFQTIGGAAGNVSGDDLLAKVLGELDTAVSRQESRLVMVLGDPAAGTRFLRELARRLTARLPDLLPVLVDAQTPVQARTIGELVYRHLHARGEDTGLSPDRFEARWRESLTDGKVILLLDGSAGSAPQATGNPHPRERRQRRSLRRPRNWPDTTDADAGISDPAADQVALLRDAATGKARIVVTRGAASLRQSELEEIRGLPRHRLLRIEDPGPASPHPSPAT